jgi:hypothetical protein
MDLPSHRRFLRAAPRQLRELFRTRRRKARCTNAAWRSERRSTGCAASSPSDPSRRLGDHAPPHRADCPLGPHARARRAPGLRASHLCRGPAPRRFGPARRGLRRAPRRSPRALPAGARKLYVKAGLLSDGEQQLLAIARALQERVSPALARRGLHTVARPRIRGSLQAARRQDRRCESVQGRADRFPRDRDEDRERLAEAGRDHDEHLRARHDPAASGPATQRQQPPDPDGRRQRRVGPLCRWPPTRPLDALYLR